MVFQGAMSVLNPVLRIGEQIAEPLLLDRRFDKTAARARVRDLLERVGLPADFASRYPTSSAVDNASASASPPRSRSTPTC